MRSEPKPDDAGTAAAGEEPRYELAAALLGQFAGFVLGVALGWYAITWGVDTLRDVMNVPELSPVPIAMFAPLWISIDVGGFSPS
ncbi:hypothetical protein [Rhodococcus jostii]|uniref:hypothetical protein n=1 Tax=Rhodococcus jostii TaxID=132919 RepID=UPI00030DEE69|nr:hypothetical protein [Rhodococcus jostii]